MQIELYSPMQYINGYWDRVTSTSLLWYISFELIFFVRFRKKLHIISSYQYLRKLLQNDKLNYIGKILNTTGLAYQFRKKKQSR